MKTKIVVFIVISFLANSYYLIAMQKDSNFWERVTTIIGPSSYHLSFTNNGDVALTGKGRASALYVSKDRADSWQITSVKGSIKGLHAASPDNLIAAVDESIYHSNDTGRTWRSLPLGWKPQQTYEYKASLANVYSPSSDTLIAFVRIAHGNNVDSLTTTVWYSPDLGVSWDSVASLSMSFPTLRVSRNTGTLIAYSTKKQNQNWYSGAIAVTRNNGKTWRMLTDSLPTRVSGVIALNNQTFLASCGSFGLYRSDDEGRTWYLTTTPSKADMECMEKSDDGVIFVGSKERYYTSTDTGQTWVSRNINNDTINVSSIHRIGRSLILMTSAGIYRDTLYPSRFTLEFDSIIVDNTTSISFLPKMTIMVGFSGGSAISSNYGSKWSNTTSRDVLTRAVCVTNKGSLLSSSESSRDNRIFLERTQRSTDNGETWQAAHEIDTNGNLYPIYARCFLPFSDTIFAGLQYGGVQRSTDDGLTWKTSRYQSEGKPPSTFIATVISLCRTRAGTYLAGYNQGMARSTDGGNIYKPALGLPNLTWVPAIIQHPTTGRIFAARTGFCEYGISYSDDDGETWISHPWWEGCVQRLAADSLGNIYASSGWEIYRSSDNGVTWENITSGLPPDNGQSYGLEGSPISSLVVASDGRLYAGLQDGGLYRSRERFPPVGVEEEALHESKPSDSSLPLRIIPNPAAESFTVHIPPSHSLGASGSVSITVRDVFGRAMYVGAGGAVSTSGWASGVYFVEVAGADGRRVVEKVVVSR